MGNPTRYITLRIHSHPDIDSWGFFRHTGDPRSLAYTAEPR